MNTVINGDALDEAVADDVYSRIKNYNEVVDDNTVNSYFDDAVTEAVYNDLLAAGYDEQQAYTLLYTGGLSIYSTQDPAIQKICDDICDNEENYPANTKWYLRYALTIQKANGDIENHSSEMFKGTVVKEDRSLMNVPFVIGDKDMEAKFIAEATEAGFINLKGHKTVGGMRASIYNAMPVEGVEKLVEFMKKFEEANA